MATMYVNFGNFDEWAAKISADNDKLLEQLEAIKDMINSLSTTYQSNAADEIRNKITGMQPRFNQYHNVIDSYARFIKATGQAYKGTEQINTNTASDFL